jgi:hypothetical protein
VEPPGDSALSTLLSWLEVKLQCELHQPRIARLQHLSERCIPEVSIRVNKLDLDEQVADVGSELEIFRLRQRNSL